MALWKRDRSTEPPQATATLPDITPISDATPRRPVYVRGQITRMRARPTTGMPALAVTVTDESGSVTAVWTGRRSIGGITLGRVVVLHGVPTRHGAALEFLNPEYTLLHR